MNKDEYVGIPNEKLAESIEQLFVGCNGIASAAIGIFSCNYMTNWEYWRHKHNKDEIYSEANKECYRRFKENPDMAYIAYEIWQMWYCAMDVRRELFGY